MDPIFGDDPVRSNRAASQQIIETLNLILEPSAFSSTPASMALEKVLYMIQTNLTFDDAGIFFSVNCQNPADRLIQVSFHVWLNNQLVYISCNAQTESLRQKVIGLQNEMLAASYVKQRWLFRLIVQNYILLIRELVSDLDLDKLPHHIRAMENNYKKSSDIDPVLARIEVMSANVQNTLVDSCLKIITNVLPLVVNSDDDMLEQCTNSACLVFSNSNLVRKTQALHFFSKIFRRRIPSNTSGFLKTLVRKLCEGIHKIRQQIMVWLSSKSIRTKDVERFLGALGFLLGIKEFVTLCQSNENRPMAYQMGAYLLQASQTDEERLLFGGKFAVAVSDFWKQIMVVELDGFQGVEDVLGAKNRLNFEPEMISLLQGSVRDWLKRGSGEEDVLLRINELIGWVEDGVSEKEEQFIGEYAIFNNIFYIT